MTFPSNPQLDTLIELWEKQQDAYVARRSERFSVILDAIEYAIQDVHTILDIGGGLGSFSKLILERFPTCRVITVDYDPSLLKLAHYNLRTFNDRSILVEEDLTSQDWTDSLEGHKPQAVVSSTALHWLSSGQLVALYEQLGAYLGKDALFFNADHLSHATSGSFFHSVSAADDAHNQRVFDDDIPDWNGWWEVFETVDGFEELIEERNRRFAGGRDNQDATAQLHVEALRVGGFSESGTLWQYFDDYVVYGVR